MTSSSFSFDIIPNISCHYHHHRCHHYYCHHYYFHSDNFLPDYQQRDSEEPLLELWPFAVEAANFKVGNLGSYLSFVCFPVLPLFSFVVFCLALFTLTHIFFYFFKWFSDQKYFYFLTCRISSTYLIARKDLSCQFQVVCVWKVSSLSVV